MFAQSVVKTTAVRNSFVGSGCKVSCYPVGRHGDGRVEGFRPDVPAFFSYLVAHDAHHRGQITQLARQAGNPLPQKAMFGWRSGEPGRLDLHA
jgi:hypothetical protein